jgi:hypothetical protein
VGLVKLCGHCIKRPWPFLVVLFVTAVPTFLVWMTLRGKDLATEMVYSWTALTFAIVGSVMLTYVVTCLRRHCSHEHSASPERGH